MKMQRGCTCCYHENDDFYLIEVDVPDDAPSLYKQANLDGRGPARFLHSDDLSDLKPRIVVVQR
jgi:hypothetical protein